ncbi:hypothetical protein FI667_g15365, partial [Globisporangium splendens]
MNRLEVARLNPRETLNRLPCVIPGATGLNGHPWRTFQARNAALPPEESPQRGSVMNGRTVGTTGIALSTEREQSPVSIDEISSQQTGDVKEPIPAAQSASPHLYSRFLPQDRYEPDIGVEETGLTARKVGDGAIAREE